jgi:hypothetical protein
MVERRDEYSENRLLFYPTSGVRIKIVRDHCMCSSYHKEPKPGAFDYTQVALTGVFVRPPPVQREKTAEEKAQDRELAREAREARASLEAEAGGSGRATFMLGLANSARNMRDTASEEVSDMLTGLEQRRNE